MNKYFFKTANFWVGIFLMIVDISAFDFQKFTFDWMINAIFFVVGLILFIRSFFKISEKQENIWNKIRVSTESKQ